MWHLSQFTCSYDPPGAPAKWEPWQPYIIRLLVSSFQKNSPAPGELQLILFWYQKLSRAIIRAYAPNYQQNFSAGKKVLSRQKTANLCVFCGR